MSANVDTEYTLEQFQLAHEAPWLDRDRRLQVDDPAVRAGMIKALEDYISIWRKGCTPPDSVAWTSGTDNNKAFLAQIVVLTANASLSVTVGLRTARPDDYYENAVTIEWPNGANAQPLVIDGGFVRAVVFKAGENRALAEEFVRFLVEMAQPAHRRRAHGRQPLAAHAALSRAGRRRGVSVERPGRAADHDYRALIIASEPIDGTAWPEIPERPAFEVTPDLRLRIEPLDES